MGESRWVIGWAMVGRAEFAYLIAQMGLAGGMMDQKLFSIVIWALLWATVFAPLVFTRVLQQFIQKNASDLLSASPTGHDVEHGAVGKLESLDIEPSEASWAGHVHEAGSSKGPEVVTSKPQHAEQKSTVAS
jgi:hypothetical protein